jgi:Domain of unknown function (DUF4124)
MQGSHPRLPTESSAAGFSQAKTTLASGIWEVRDICLGFVWISAAADLELALTLKTPSFREGVFVMRILNCFLACLLGLALGGTASAQVYESKDAQGNPVFSDKPSAGAEVVKVPPTNSADPVADAPERPEPAAAPRPGTGAAAPGRRVNDTEDDDDPYFYYGGADVDEEAARERREEARERREEGAVRPDGERPPGATTLPAAPRRAAGGGRR